MVFWVVVVLLQGTLDHLWFRPKQTINLWWCVFDVTSRALSWQAVAVAHLPQHCQQDVREPKALFALCCPVCSPAAIDVNKNGTVERNEFADFIFHLAVADLKTTEAASGTVTESE